MTNATEIYQAHTLVPPIPREYPCTVTCRCKCGAEIKAISFEALQFIFALHQITETQKEVLTMVVKHTPELYQKTDHGYWIVCGCGAHIEAGKDGNDWSKWRNHILSLGEMA
jgi:hypothetical protein